MLDAVTVRTPTKLTRNWARPEAGVAADDVRGLRAARDDDPADRLARAGLGVRDVLGVGD